MSTPPSEWKKSLSTLRKRRNSSLKREDRGERSSDGSSQHSVLHEKSAIEVEDNDVDCELVDPALTAYQSLTPAFKMRSRNENESTTSPRFDVGRTERLMEFTSQAWDRLGASPSLASSTFIHETPSRASKSRTAMPVTPSAVTPRAEAKTTGNATQAEFTPVQATPASRPKTSPPSSSPSIKQTPNGLRVGDEWKPARMENGRTYYYNRRTRKSAWNLPADAIVVRVGNIEKIFVPASPSNSPDLLSETKKGLSAATPSALTSVTPIRFENTTNMPAAEPNRSSGEPTRQSSHNTQNIRQLPVHATPIRPSHAKRPFTTPIASQHTTDDEQVNLATPEDDAATFAVGADSPDLHHNDSHPASKPRATTSNDDVRYHEVLESEEDAVHALETRRKLFTEDSFAITNVYCVFCGLHIPLPDLADHFTNCLAFERIRTTDIHKQLQTALVDSGVVPSPKAHGDEEGSLGFETCPECGRSFATGRLDGHVKVCKRVFKEKRPVYDATQKRLQGTPMQYYENSQQTDVGSPVRSRNSSVALTPARFDRENMSTALATSNANNHMRDVSNVTPSSPPRDLIRKMPTATESPSKPTPISIALFDDTDQCDDSEAESPAVKSACPFCQRMLSKTALSSHLLSCRKLKNIRAKRNNPTPRKAAHNKPTHRKFRAATTVTPMKYR